MGIGLTSLVTPLATNTSLFGSVTTVGYHRPMQDGAVEVQL